MSAEVPYYDDLPKYQILVFGERDDPAAYYLTVEKGVPAYYSAVKIKRAWQINFARERINFTRNEIELMKDWELNVDWEKSLIVDKAINFYGQKQQSRLEKNLAAFKKQSKKGND